MNNLYEQFNCKSKEELYEKIKQEDRQVQPLLDFIEYAKADIKNKNRAIKSPETFVDYVKSTTLPTKDAGTFIFVDTKNQPVLLKRARLSRKNDMRDTLKEGLVSGGTRAFIAYSEDTPNSRMVQIQSLFENIGMKIVDSLGYSKDRDAFISTLAGHSFYSSNSYELVGDGDSEYLKEDFSLKEEYTDFSSHFAINEIVGLNVIKDTEILKEKLKIGFQHHHQEVLGIVAYNNDENVISAEELFKGGTDYSLVDLKIIAKSLLGMEDLKGIAVFHNHPSGVPGPSREDLAMTDRINQMCNALEVELLDHFIIGKEKTLSFSEEIDEFQSKNYRYQDKVSNLKNVSEESMSYQDVKNTIEDIMNNNYEGFVKTLISVEKGVEDENILDELYDRFMDNDGVNLINDYFDEALFDMEQENTVSEAIKIRENVSGNKTNDKKPINKEKSLLEELKKNKVKTESRDLKKEKESNIVSL